MNQLFVGLLLLLSGLAQAQFDHDHAAWDCLLKRHVTWLPDNKQSPRVHAAVNCASIALRNEAFSAAKLEAQLEDGMQRFLADRTRKRVRDGRLEVSAIFKWFRSDFEQGHQGFAKVEDVFAKYATQLSDKPDEQAQLRAKTLPVNHLDYDWSLNGWGR